jgi:hypothetical protein
MLLLTGKSMTKAIRFQRDARFCTIRIQIILSKRMLAAEFIRRESTVSQQTPQRFFSPGLPPTQLPSTAIEFTAS